MIYVILFYNIIKRLTGSDKKCEFLKDNIEIDGVINYKNNNYFSKLKKLCPNGIDGYFDNVGEDMLNNIIRLMNLHGRIALCGNIATY